MPIASDTIMIRNMIPKCRMILRKKRDLEMGFCSSFSYMLQMFWVKLIKISITLAYPHFAVLGKGYLYCGLTGNLFPMADAPLDESSEYLIQRVAIVGQDIFRDNGEFINQHIARDKAIGLHGFQLRGEYLGRYARYGTLYIIEPFVPFLEGYDDPQFPFAPDDVQGILHGIDVRIAFGLVHVGVSFHLIQILLLT